MDERKRSDEKERNKRERKKGDEGDEAVPEKKR